MRSSGDECGEMPCNVMVEHMQINLDQEAVKDDLLIPSPQQLGSESS